MSKQASRRNFLFGTVAATAAALTLGGKGTEANPEKEMAVGLDRSSVDDETALDVTDFRDGQVRHYTIYIDGRRLASMVKR